MSRQSEVAYQQTIEMCKLTVSFFGYYVRSMEQKQMQMQTPIQYPNRSVFAQSSY